MGVFKRKSKDDALDYKKINEGIGIGVNLLRVIFILAVALLIFVCSKPWSLEMFFKVCLNYC